jgi:hypothetical protein
VEKGMPSAMEAAKRSWATAVTSMQPTLGKKRHPTAWAPGPPRSGANQSERS